MKKLLTGLVCGVTILTSSLVYADVLGGADDRYIGFQMTIPLDRNRKSLFSDKAEYSVMLIDQTDGIKKGIAITQDIYGNQTIGYVNPSYEFEIGQSKVSDYTLPIINLNEGSRFRISQAETTEENVVLKTAAGALAVVAALAVGALLIEEAAKIAVVAVAECVTGETCTPSCCVTTN